MRATSAACATAIALLTAVAACNRNGIPRAGTSESGTSDPPVQTPDGAPITPTTDTSNDKHAPADGNFGTAVATFQVGGSVRGLTGTVGLRVTGVASELVVSASGAFAFPTLFASRQAYDVTVSTQPATELCTVTDGQGAVAAADVTTIDVQCAAAFPVGGSVTGASGGLVLANAGGAPYVVNGDGAFTFPTRLPGGSTLDVHVVSAPAGQGCAVVTHASGTVTAAVTDIAVRCFSTYASCNALHVAQPQVPSGVYPIAPAGTAFNAYCDMVDDGGGWTRAANLRPDTNFQGDLTGALGDVSRDAELGKLDDALITSLSTVGYFRFNCGSTFNGFVKTAEGTWSSLRSNTLTWSVDPTRSGTFSCPANRDGYVFSSVDGTDGPCGAVGVSYVASDGATEGGGCYVEGEGWGRFGNLWVK